MKIVIDTNIFINATFAKTGASAKILELIDKGKLKLLVSEDILAEYKYQLGFPYIAKRHEQSAKNIAKTIDRIISKAKIVKVEYRVRLVHADPSDNKFLECAYAAGAEFIVSSDNHLLSLKSWQDIQIVTPGEFLKLLD